MKIVTHKPMARGVNQLMYVGDDPGGAGVSPLLMLGVALAATVLILRWR